MKVKIVNAFRDRRQPACGTAYVCGYMATFFDASVRQTETSRTDCNFNIREEQRQQLI